jgi:DnaJ-class molecular chaperone
MVEYDVIPKRTNFTFSDLYQLGWDGTNEKITDSISSYINGNITDILFIGKSIQVNWEMLMTTYHDNEIDNGITEVNCPICNGEGQYDYNGGGHSHSKLCEHCKGTGKVHISTVI